MKFCTTCKRYENRGGSELCTRKAWTQNDMITGELSTIGLLDARRERDTTGADYCGPDGLFYEAKP